jgi:2-polyprenyl-3-methyl-5-hydroxy-6-metoxy-1,4-benzoquinol methylase
MAISEDRTRETQYQFQISLDAEYGRARLGLMTNASWREDPRRLLFLLSRYKFVAKILSGKKKVLEIGCGDAFGTRMVLQTVESIHAVDFDPVFVKDVNERMDPAWKFVCHVHDMLEGPVNGVFDAAYSLDVLEHIQPKVEDKFVANIMKSLTPDAVLILGMPSLQSQAYASHASKAGHVNCKDEPTFRQLMERYFRNVFMFSMNDEVVHTGYYPMAQYLLALCVAPREFPK